MSGTKPFGERPAPSITRRPAWRESSGRHGAAPARSPARAAAAAPTHSSSGQTRARQRRGPGGATSTAWSRAARGDAEGPPSPTASRACIRRSGSATSELDRSSQEPEKLLALLQPSSTAQLTGRPAADQPCPQRLWARHLVAKLPLSLPGKPAVSPSTRSRPSRRGVRGPVRATATAHSCRLLLHRTRWSC